MNGKSKFADQHHHSLHHTPVGRPVGDGYGFSVFDYNFYHPRPSGIWWSLFSYVLSVLFPEPPLGLFVYYANPPPTQHTNPLSVLSADRSHSLHVTSALSSYPPLYRTLHLLSPPTCPLFSVLIASDSPLRFRVKKEKRNPCSFYRK